MSDSGMKNNANLLQVAEVKKYDSDLTTDANKIN